MTIFLFLFFFTLHADQLGIVLPVCNIRINNLLALILLLQLSVRGNLSIISLDRPLFKGLLFILCSIITSLFLSFDSVRSLLFGGWFVFTIICYLLLPLFLMNILGEKAVIKTYMSSFLWVGIYALCQFLLSIFGFTDPFIEQTFTNSFLVRPNAMAHEPSYYALYMTPFVMMTNLRALLRKSSFAFILFVNVLYLVSTSTAVFFAYLIFGAILLISTFFPWIKCHYPKLRRQLFRFMGGFFSAFILIFAFFPSFAREFFLKFFFKGLSHHSFRERWVGIVDAFHIFKEHPIFGVGLGSYPSYLMDLWQNGEKNLTIRPDFFSVQNPLKLFEPTNVTMEVLASLGIVGFFAFGYLFWQYGKKAKWALMNAEDSEERDMCFAFFISMIVTIIVFQFNQGIMRSYIWVHFALSFGYFTNLTSRLCRGKEEEIVVANSIY